MRREHKLTPFGEATIRGLRSEGIALSDADVVLLAGLCRDLESPAIEMELSQGAPVQVGVATLYPMTIAGWDWYERQGHRMPMPDVALGYAMAHGREPGIDAATWRDVKHWFHRLNATSAELEQAVAIILEQSDKAEIPQSKSASGLSCGELVAIMQARFGGSAETWERYVSLDYINGLLMIANAQESAGGYSQAIRDRGHLALAYALEAIRRRCENE